MTKIYLSSTYSDLKPYRDAVYQSLQRSDYIDKVIAMEDYVATDSRPLDKCLVDVEKCDVYIGLFAWRYGYIPKEDNPQHKSITELEYRKASELGKPRLIFLLDKKALWMPEYMDIVNGEGNKGAFMQALCEELEQEHVVSFFTSPDHLASLVSAAITNAVKQAEQITREQFLQTRIIDQSGFLLDRLQSFVGRQTELEELRHRIQENIRTGGYVTITGQAGQGKSSVIAKLVKDYGPENVAHHFIPFNPGPDYQVSLLRNLMARLILKYDLSDLYVASESRTVLRDYLPKVLADLTTKGNQAVIFIDGLDQLEEDTNGVRDLSFLPTSLPSGIVFVLGTRPNDTLKPLVLLHAHFEYHLPVLSRTDFDLVLAHRHAKLDRALADQIYTAMQENALYLDLVARELTGQVEVSPQDLVLRIGNNPANIFSLAIDRLKRDERKWRSAIKPILGVLLAEREPLALGHIRRLLHREDDQIKDGIAKLGGLIADNGRGAYSLFHLKLQDYLKQDEQQPGKDYIFATDEEQVYHARLAQWCEKDLLTLVWQDTKDPYEQGRREYARKHYITHFYLARHWQQMFAVLDRGDYGSAKIDHDPSMRSYAQDLDLGRQAAATEKGLDALLRLWRYTVLRCSLTSHADAYPLETFQMLLALKREKEALGLADLLTQTTYRAQVLAQIAKHLLQQPHQKKAGIQILLSANEIAHAGGPNLMQITTLVEIGEMFLQLQQPERAEQVWAEAEASLSSLNEYAHDHKGATQKLGVALVLAQQWQRAESIVCKLEEAERDDVLKAVAEMCIQTQQWDGAKALIQRIEDKGQALGELGAALARVGQEDAAASVCREAVIIMCEPSRPSYRARGLQELAQIFMKAQQSQCIQKIGREIENLLQELAEYEGNIHDLLEKAEAFMIEQEWEQARVFLLEAERLLFPSEKADWNTAATTRLADGSSPIAKHFDYVRSMWGRTNIVKYSQYNPPKDRYQRFRDLLEAKHWKEARSIADTKMWPLHELGMALVKAKQLEDIETIADQIRDDGQSDWKEKIELLNKIGMIAVQTQQLEGVEIILKRVKQCAYREGRNNYDDIFKKIVEIFIQKKMWKESEYIIENMWVKWEALRNLKEALRKEKQWSYVENILKRVEDHGKLTGEFHYEKKEFDSLIIEMENLADLQHWSKAEALTQKTKNIVWRADLFIKLGELLGQAQKWKQAARTLEKAEAIALTMRDQTEKSPILHGLVDAFISIQQWEKALTLIITQNLSTYMLETEELIAIIAQKRQWKQVEEIIQFGKRHEVDNLVFFLLGLGDVLIQAQQWRAVEIIIELVKRGKEDNAKVILGELGKMLVQAQQWKLVDTIVEIIWQYKDDRDKVKSLGRLAVALLQMDQQERAEVLLTEVERIIIKERSKWYSHDMLYKGLPMLANMLIEAQQWEQAKKMIGRRGRISRDIKAELWVALGDALVQVQDKDGAEEAWKQAEIVIHSNLFIEKYITVKIVSALGKSLAQVEEWERADAMWVKAETIALKISDVQDRARALEYLGEALIEAQQWERAEAVAQMIPKIEEQSKVLRQLGISLGQAGKWEQAQKVAQTMILPELGKSLMQAEEWDRAEAVIQMLGEDHAKVELLQHIADHLVQTGRHEEFFHFLQRAWLQAKTRNYCLELLTLLFDFIDRNPELALSFCRAFTWVDAFLEGKDLSSFAFDSIQESDKFY